MAEYKVIKFRFGLQLLTKFNLDAVSDIFLRDKSLWQHLLIYPQCIREPQIPSF